MDGDLFICPHCTDRFHADEHWLWLVRGRFYCSQHCANQWLIGK